MTVSITTATVEVQSGALKIPAYIAYPACPEACPAVVVLQEVFGVNEHIREVTDRIAREGYIAIAPHIYHRQVQDFEVGYSPAELELGRRYKAGTTADELLSDVQGAIAYIHQNFDGVPAGAGCIGFCFGGHVAYLAATLSSVRATASFYGAGIATSSPGGGFPTLNRTSNISGVVYCFFGMDDPLIPVEHVDDVEAALRQATVKPRVFRYPGVGHGFFCNRRDSYDAPSSQDAWEHVKRLFNEELRGANSQ